MKKTFLFAATMLLAVSVASATQSAVVTNEVNDSIEAAAALPKVYSNCYVLSQRSPSSYNPVADCG